MENAHPAPTQTSRRAGWIAEARSWAVLALLVYAFHSLVAKPFYIPSESMMTSLQVGDHIVVSKYPYGWSYASASFHLLPFMKGRLFGRTPERGDIVVLSRIDRAGRTEDLIKRVVGLPGDTVRMVEGRLWLNGKPVASGSLGTRLIPIDGNFHCDAADPDPERAFPGFHHARVTGQDGKPYCRVHAYRETLPNGRSYDVLDFGRTAADDTDPYVVPAGHLFLLGDNRDNSADSRVPTALNGLGGAIPVENIGGRAEFITYSLAGNAGWSPLTWFDNFRRNRWGRSLRLAGRGVDEVDHR